MLGLKLNHVSKRGHREKAIAVTHVDPDLFRHMASLSHSVSNIDSNIFDMLHIDT